MGLISEFRDFAMRGNVVDMAVGIIIGGAFGTIVKSMVDDVLMPPIGMALGGMDFGDQAWLLREATTKLTDDGKTVEVPAVMLRYGSFLNAVISFLIVAFCLFLIIKAMNTAKKRFEKQQAAAPAAPAADVVLLTEIRDLLARKH